MLTSEHLQPHNTEFHSKFPEQSRNSLKDAVQGKGGHTQTLRVHSEYREPSWHSSDTMNVGRSRVQAASRVDSQHVPLTGYEQYPPEVQTYPVTREPVNVQPMPTNNNSALLDLPNVQTGLPMPLIPQQAEQPVMENRGERAENPTLQEQVQMQSPAVKYWSLFRFYKQQIYFRR